MIFLPLLSTMAHRPASLRGSGLLQTTASTQRCSSPGQSLGHLDGAACVG
jgi:hypothetical protein